MILGLSVRALQVTQDDNYSLRGVALREALEEDERSGRKPFVLSEPLDHRSAFQDNNNQFSSCYCWYDFVWSGR